MSHGAYVYVPGEGPVLDMGPFRMTLKASAGGTGGSLTLLEADEPPDFGPPMHIHQDAGEAFYVLAGEYVVFIAGAEYRCPAGSFVYVPSAMEGYFGALAEAVSTGDPMDEGRLTALAAEHFMTVTGPVPENYV